MPGLHWALNSLSVLAAAKSAGVELAAAAAALAQLQPLKGRGQRVKIAAGGGSFELIDESYNASPAAMRAAFQVLAQARPGHGGRRIAVLGDMRELGDDRAPAACRSGARSRIRPRRSRLHRRAADGMAA